MDLPTYLRKKNKILDDALNVTLIPEDQIVDLPITTSMVKIMLQYIAKYRHGVYNKGEIYLNEKICPYCAMYVHTYDCNGCPMNKANNCCHDSDSTFKIILRKINYHTDIETRTDIQLKLVKLAEEFVKANKGLLND